MGIVIFCPPTAKKRVDLDFWKQIDLLISDKEVRVCETIDEFVECLICSLGHLSTAVLFAASQKDLSHILTVRHLLHSTHTLVLLPDRKRSTIKKGHSLKPRFLSFIDSDPTTVISVLSNMLKYAGCNRSKSWSRIFELKANEK